MDLGDLDSPPKLSLYALRDLGFLGLRSLCATGVRHGTRPMALKVALLATLGRSWGVGLKP